MGPGVQLWGWDGTIWRKARVDATGHLQVDVITAGGTTCRLYGYDTANWQYLQVEAAALHNLRVKLYDGANGIDSLLSAGSIEGKRCIPVVAQLWGHITGAAHVIIKGTTLNADNFDATKSGLVTASALYGYNGASWDRLRVESNTEFNLRTRLYGGANAVFVGQSAAAFAYTNYGIETFAVLYADDGMNLSRVRMLMMGVDGLSNLLDTLAAASMLYGFNGATWDRLRTWGLGVLKVGRAEIDSTTVRVTAAGAVVGGAHNIYWIACSPDAPNAEFELTDAIAALGAVVYDHFDADKHSEHLTFDPPMKFTTGIYVETFTNMHSLVFCYV